MGLDVVGALLAWSLLSHLAQGTAGKPLSLLAALCCVSLLLTWCAVVAAMLACHMATTVHSRVHPGVCIPKDTPEWHQQVHARAEPHNQLFRCAARMAAWAWRLLVLSQVPYCAAVIILFTVHHSPGP